MPADRFDEASFRNKVSNAISSVRRIVDITKIPVAADIQYSHTYDDKFLLAEILTDTTIASQLNCLEAIGLDKEKLNKIIDWSKTQSVTLLFRGNEKCEFLREVKRKEESPDKHVTEASGLLNVTVTTKIITNIREFFYKFDTHYEIIVYKGNAIDGDETSKITLYKQDRTIELLTTVEDEFPRPATATIKPKSVNITWLLQQLHDIRYTENQIVPPQPHFTINRSQKTCRTPRRNPNIYDAFAFYGKLFNWCKKVVDYFRRDIFTLQVNDGVDKLDLRLIEGASLFVPAVPLFQTIASQTEEERMCTIVSWDIMGDLIDHQKTSMHSRITQLQSIFPANEKLITNHEVRLVIVLDHINSTINQYFDSVNFIEKMLYDQLYSAIGKVLTPEDFQQYMFYHNRVLFKEAYQQETFCYAVRRPDYSPEGIFSIETNPKSGEIGQPIPTITNHTKIGSPMSFAINPATSISLFGDRYVHGCIRHQFAEEPVEDLYLTVRTRQFSCFMLLVGTMITGSKFEPTTAVIVKDKDEITIPLSAESLPTPKQFRDAIESLSPDQQAFCKAFRSMQLESTLFTVCIVQIKPQLERVLNLPATSLTKEIQLTQDLLDLLIDYQISPDLLAVSQLELHLPVELKIDAVRQNVKTVNDLIQHFKDEQLRELEEKRQAQLLMEKMQRDAELARQRAVLSEQTHDVKYEFADRCKSSAPKLLMSRGGAPGGGRGGAPPVIMRKGAAPQKNSSASPARKSKASSSSAMSFGSVAPPVAQSVSTSIAPSSASSIAPSASLAPSTSSIAPSTSLAPPPAPIVVAPIVVAPVVAPVVAVLEPTPVVVADPVVKKESVDVVEIPSARSSSNVDELDVTKVPAQLDSNFEALDEDAALRATILSLQKTWSFTHQKGLLGEPQTSTMNEESQKTAKNKAFDLLDGLTRSGALAFEEASVHVVIAATHCFDKEITDTVIQDNMNPIEKLERSLLIMASTIQQKPVDVLVNEDQLERVKSVSPQLFSETLQFRS